MSDRADHRAGARPGLKAQTADAPVAPASARGSALQSANLFDLIRERAGAPNQLALETSDATALTYSALIERSGRAANALVALGVQPGDRVDGIGQRDSF